jgi:hypothetical protein
LDNVSQIIKYRKFIRKKGMNRVKRMKIKNQSEREGWGEYGKGERSVGEAKGNLLRNNYQ